MSLMDKFKDIVGIEEFDEEDVSDEELEAANREMERRRVVDNRATRQKSREKVVDMYGSKGDAMKMIVLEPETFEECQGLVGSLKEGKPVILNLEKIDSETARKIFDFLGGATYALDGVLQKVADNIFIFAPPNIAVKANNESPSGFDFTSSQDNWR